MLRGFNLDFVKYLLSKGCNINETFPSISPSFRTEENILASAISVMNEEMIKHIVAKIHKNQLNFVIFSNGNNQILNLIEYADYWEAKGKDIVGCVKAL